MKRTARKIIKITPQGKLGRFSDYLARPIMYLLQLNFRESPRLTFPWNVMVMPAYILKEVKQENIFKAVDGESSNRYAVFEPNDTDSVWFVGWSRKGESAKVSRVVLSGPVRVRIGTKNTSVFGFSLLGKEIQLNKIGEDNSGTGGEFSLIPLL